MSARNAKDMPFLDHLEELRLRILKTLAAILVFAIAGFFFSDQLFEFLQYPLKKGAPDIELHFFGITEAFMTRIKLAFLAGLFVAMPVALYQIWQFVVPGLLESEVKVAVPLVAVSSVFFLTGAGFCFFVVARYGLRFLIMVNQPPNTTPVIGLGSYFSYVMWLMIAFGAVFQLPVVTFFLGRIGIVNSRLLAKGRSYAVVGILVLSSLITPPDIFTQVVLSVPLYFLYELSIFVVKLTGKREEGEETDDEA